MKSIKLYTLSYFVFFMLLTGSLFAQSMTNLTGTFEGTRSQFDRNHQNLVKEFTYKFELIQKDNIISGTSVIISEEGNYAEVGVRGVVIKDKFYFEEYEMIDQLKAPSMVWCYKSGVLDIKESKGEIILIGKTPSYMVNYGYACTGGFTRLSALGSGTNEARKISIEDEAIDLTLYPVPANNMTSLTFTAEENTSVTVEIIDLSGRTVLKPVTRNIPKGSFDESFDVSKFAPGMYIFKITIEDVVYTKELLKTK